jgi:hypothetical protein
MSLLVDMDGDIPRYFHQGNTKDKFNITVRMLKKNPLQHTQDIMKVYAELKPIRSQVQHIILETTQDFADSIQRYLWLLPITVALKVKN